MTSEMTLAPFWEMTKKIIECLILKTMVLGLPNCIPFLLLMILIYVCYYIIFTFTAALHLFYRISTIGNALTRITHVTWGPFDDPPVCGSTAEVKSLVTYAVYEFFIDSEKRVTCRDNTQKHALYFNTFSNLNSCSNVKIVIIYL